MNKKRRTDVGSAKVTSPCNESSPKFFDLLFSLFYARVDVSRNNSVLPRTTYHLSDKIHTRSINLKPWLVILQKKVIQVELAVKTKI